jgi:GNAT superfamily N-acetyltransferase
MASPIHLQFRIAHPDDITRMSAIRLAVTENVLSDPSKITLQMYRDYMETLGQAWVCEADGIVVGFCYAVREDGSIWALFVDQAFEGLGIATRLLDMACLWLLETGKSEAKLSTTPDTRADRFYVARGWQRRHADEGKDAYFSKQLTPSRG